MGNSDLHSALVDELLELYCEWREDSARVQTAYERFAAAEPPERTVAFAVYMAALDQEESAAATYAEQIGVAAAQLQNDGVSRPDPAPAESVETRRAPSSSRT